MTPINLSDFTDSTKKIPTTLIQHIPEASHKIQKRKIAIAHAFDLLMVISATSFVSEFLQASLSRFMVTSELRAAFSQINYSSFMISLLPLMFTSYFFFSYFLNHGQTWGMKKMKTRVAIPAMSYRSSLVWAMFSASALMTAGLTLLAYPLIHKKGWGEMKDEDYLYVSLVQHKEIEALNLVEVSSRNNNLVGFPVQKDEEESVLEAA